jgi:hypothetical protein
MMKKRVIYLIIGLIVIAATLIFIFVINPALSKTGSFVEEVEDSEQNIFDNVLIDPSAIGVNIKPGQELTNNFEVINNGDQTLFFRCGIYSKNSRDKYAPSSTCTSEGEKDGLGFIEIPAGKKEEFSVKTETQKDSKYFTLELEEYSVTTKKGTYEDKILISVGTKAEEQEVKEIPLSILVE